MNDAYLIEGIDATTFISLLNEYPNVVPEKLSKLDKQRYAAIPEAVAERSPEPFLDKDQIALLVDWKLSHGKFRPTLKGLVQQNAEEFVTDTTKEGFESFSRSVESAKVSLNILTRLKGIGPATASLLLSIFDPDVAPFFSDELFRWCLYENGKGKGWDREIKYNLKEYLQLFQSVQELRSRFEEDFEHKVTAVQIEKVAYVLGKRSMNSLQDAAAATADDGKKRKAPSKNDAEAVESLDAEPATKAAKDNARREPREVKAKGAAHGQRKALRTDSRSTKS